MRSRLVASCGLGLALAALTSSGGVARPSSSAFSVDNAAPHGIVYNPSGALKGLWYTNATTNHTSAVVEFLVDSGRTKQYPTPTSGAMPGSINIAPDSSLWFTETATDKVATIGASRRIVEYAIPTANSKPLDITRGPDGAMWFTESAVGKIGRAAADGTITEYTVGSAATEPTSLITGPDGAIWFTEVGAGQIGRLTMQGSIRHFNAGPGRLSGGLTIAKDHALWFNKNTAVTRMTATGALTDFPLPSGVFATGGIFGSSRGGVYLGAIKRNGVGAIVSESPSGTTSEYDLPKKHLLPIELAQAASGAFWMTVSSFKQGVSPSTVFELSAVQPSRPTISDLPRATIVIGGAPDWMTTGSGALWIANITLKEVERVDATTNAVTARIKVRGVPCSGIAYGFASVWVPICGAHGTGVSLIRIDAATNRVQKTLPIAPASSEGGIATSPDSVWLATADGVLSRIDPGTDSVRKNIRVASGSLNPAYAGGAIWITSGTASLLTAIDAGSGRTIARIPVASKPHFLTTGGGAVWTVNQGDGSVTKVDMRSRRAVARIRANIPGFGGDVTYGAGFVWPTLVGVPLTKIDAASNRVAGQWYGRGGDAIRFGYGSVWLVDYNHGLVWRINPDI
jgi:streptogramin lyase